MSAIEIHDLTKDYGTLRALRGISLSVEPGEVFCLLGPNGAGKTTTVEILEGYRLPTSGQVRVLGCDPANAPRTWRDKIGAVLQENSVPEDLSVRELLQMYGGWYSRPLEPSYLIELVELDAKEDSRIRQLSGGQRRRLDLALALVGDPELIFLDEPTTGFDPSARRRAWSTIRALCRLGKTVVLTTHFMDEAQYLADRVAVMVDGSIVAEGTPESLGGRESMPTEIRFALPSGLKPRDLPSLADCLIRVENGAVLITSEDALKSINSLSSWALGRGLELPNLSMSKPTLEDIYLSLTGSTHKEV